MKPLKILLLVGFLYLSATSCSRNKSESCDVKSSTDLLLQGKDQQLWLAGSEGRIMDMNPAYLRYSYTFLFKKGGKVEFKTAKTGQEIPFVSEGTYTIKDSVAFIHVPLKPADGNVVFNGKISFVGLINGSCDQSFNMRGDWETTNGNTGLFNSSNFLP
ncbi:MAG: hypothetical protein BGN92_12490 [Sphingobacteriales bacterium 41-5]|nr:MAG: hypothetical protein BGN92_12490 [Sphingobacteriales bacterium 41-5]